MNRSIKTTLAASAALLVTCAAPAGIDGFGGMFGGASTAHAQGSGQGGGGQGGGQGAGGQGAGGGGQDAGGGGQGAGGGGQAAGGQGAPSPDAEGQGPRGGQSGKPSTTGKPSWAQEGIPEVELGRLSVARSPDAVLDRALSEVLSNWSSIDSYLYSKTSDAFAVVAETSWDSIAIVDSPLQNLALMEAILDDPSYASTTLGVTPASQLDLAAILLGVASDKVVAITTDTVAALNVIMDLDLSASEIATLAAKAEDVRDSVLLGHG